MERSALAEAKSRPFGEKVKATIQSVWPLSSLIGFCVPQSQSQIPEPPEPLPHATNSAVGEQAKATIPLYASSSGERIPSSAPVRQSTTRMCPSEWPMTSLLPSLEKLKPPLSASPARKAHGPSRAQIRWESTS